MDSRKKAANRKRLTLPVAASNVNIPNFSGNSLAATLATRFFGDKAMAGFFKTLLAGDRLIRVFCAGRLMHPIAVEMFALAGGYDGLWLDQEHSGATIEQIYTSALAARARGMGSFVRLPMTSYATVTQALESGVDGVMAAQINSAAEAEQFVRWAKFAPRGNRGLNSQGSDGDFTYKPWGQFAPEANRDHFTAIQIETLGALAEADAIAATPDVDLLFIGPADLSQSLGQLGNPNHPSVWEAIERVAAACKNRGKHWGIVPFDVPCAERCVELGCRMLTFGNDLSAMRLGIKSLKEQFAKFF